MRSLALVSVFVLAASACERGGASPAPPTTTGSAPVVAAPRVAAPRVARIAFIDKADACDCTRKRVEGTWAALQSALGTPATLPVERIHLDTQPARAETYTLLEPLMVPPGVYFVDGGDAVIELLQGEVTIEQIAAVLNR